MQRGIFALHAETGFEKYRIVQDRLFESDFDRLLKAAESLSLAVSQKPHKKQKAKHEVRAGICAEFARSRRAC